MSLFGTILMQETRFLPKSEVDLPRNKLLLSWACSLTVIGVQSNCRGQTAWAIPPRKSSRMVSYFSLIAHGVNSYCIICSNIGIKFSRISTLGNRIGRKSVWRVCTNP